MTFHWSVAQVKFAARRASATLTVLAVCTMWLSGVVVAQESTKTSSNGINSTTEPRVEKSAPSNQIGKTQSTATKPATKTPVPRVNAAQLIDSRRNAAKQAVRSSKPSNAPAPYADTYTPAYAPLSANANANLRARASSIQIANVPPRTASASDAFAKNQSLYSVIVTPTSIDANVLRNIYEPLTAPAIEVGDRPTRGTSLCSDGRLRRFGDIDMRAFAQTLPDFNVARPRTVCVRRGVLMADYFFK
jgi:hypothetical protein